VAADAQGNVIAAGILADASPLGDDLVVLKLLGAGVLSADVVDGGGTSGRAHAVAIDGAGDVVTAGAWADPFTVIKISGSGGIELRRDQTGRFIAKRAPRPTICAE